VRQCDFRPGLFKGKDSFAVTVCARRADYQSFYFTHLITTAAAFARFFKSPIVRGRYFPVRAGDFEFSGIVGCADVGKNDAFQCFLEFLLFSGHFHDKPAVGFREQDEIARDIFSDTGRDLRLIAAPSPPANAIPPPPRQCRLHCSRGSLDQAFSEA